MSSRQGEQTGVKQQKKYQTGEAAGWRCSRQEVQQAAAGRKSGRQQRAATSEKLKNELQESSDQEKLYIHTTYRSCHQKAEAGSSRQEQQQAGTEAGRSSIRKEQDQAGAADGSSSSW